MEKLVTAKLNYGMDSCVRVLNLMRRKGIEVENMSMEDGKIYIRVADELMDIVQLNLQSLSDVSLI